MSAVQRRASPQQGSLSHSEWPLGASGSLVPATAAMAPLVHVVAFDPSWCAGDAEASVHVLQQLTRSSDECQAQGQHQPLTCARGRDARGAVPYAQDALREEEIPGAAPGRSLERLDICLCADVPPDGQSHQRRLFFFRYRVYYH